MTESMPQRGHRAVCPTPCQASVHSVISAGPNVSQQKKHPKTLLARTSSRCRVEWRWARMMSGVTVGVLLPGKPTEKFRVLAPCLLFHLVGLRRTVLAAALGAAVGRGAEVVTAGRAEADAASTTRPP